MSWARSCERCKTPTTHSRFCWRCQDILSRQAADIKQENARLDYLIQDLVCDPEVRCKPDEAARLTVEMHRDTLISFRKMTPKSEELEWEIRVYEYILKDPKKRYDEYNQVRFKNGNGAPRAKRIVVKELGWDIP